MAVISLVQTCTNFTEQCPIIADTDFKKSITAAVTRGILALSGGDMALSPPPPLSPVPEERRLKYHQTESYCRGFHIFHALTLSSTLITRFSALINLQLDS